MSNTRSLYRYAGSSAIYFWMECKCYC